MNLLVVDIGNTDIKFGVFQGDTLIRHWRATGTRTHPEKFSAMLRDSLAVAGAEFDVLVYTSVVPEVEFVFRKTMQYCFHLPESRIFAIEPKRMQLPLDMSRYPLEQLGMDRLVNACGASLMYPETNLIVVDFGTATTFDLVNSAGEYLGGAIAPGLQTFSESLSQKTAKLPNLSVIGKRSNELAMGVDTVSSIEAGLGFGYRGLVRELLKASAQVLDTREFLLIGTGGLAEPVIQLCGMDSFFHVVDPMLTLKGLQLLYLYTQDPSQFRKKTLTTEPDDALSGDTQDETPLCSESI
jgi:type III pantothenate kinase